MIHLFTVACPEPSSDAWWARLLETDRSYCFVGLTALLEPEATHPARFAWLDGLAEGLELEDAQRLTLLRGFPDYFERLWERSRVDGAYHIGNADHSTHRFLPGLFLLWPDMAFLFSYRDGIGAVEAAAASGADFEAACVEWAESVRRLRAAQQWLARRGARVGEARLERIVSRPAELRETWTWLLGEWDRTAERAEAHVRELEATLEPVESISSRWPDERRRLFHELCGDAQAELGYRVAPTSPRA
jgi:hypothetical protein